MKYWNKAWSLVSGCTAVSPACDNCWLRGIDKRFGKGWDGNVIAREDRLTIPLRTRKPTVFAIWSDLFHEAVPDEFIDAAYAVMVKAHQHTFLILTKRPRRMAEWCEKERMRGIFAGTLVAKDGGIIRRGWPVSNIWHGTTVENQQTADVRIPHLLMVPGNRWLSVEPMLGPVDLEREYFSAGSWHDARCRIGAVICGGESGPGARPMHPAWIRSLKDQCAMSKVPFTFKQWGPRNAGHLLYGQEYINLPWRL